MVRSGGRPPMERQGPKSTIPRSGSRTHFSQAQDIARIFRNQTQTFDSSIPPRPTPVPPVLSLATPQLVRRPQNNSQSESDSIFNQELGAHYS